MISSSRGTSHLFSISPHGGGSSANFHYSENSFVNNNFVVDPTAKTAIRRPQTTSSFKLSDEKSIFFSAPPVTLSVVSRIRSGNNGLKGAVRGAAAFATGFVSPIPGAIASAFHNCKGFNSLSDANSAWTKYYLLVFSPSGCIVQYVLHQNTEFSDFSGLSAVSNGSSKETDTKFVVEALQKWDVCHKRSRRDRVESVDIYGDHGNGESTKLFQKGVKKGTSVYPSDSAFDAKAKPSAEENHHSYISEIELQMHAVRIPLWSRSGVLSYSVLIGKLALVCLFDYLAWLLDQLFYSEKHLTLKKL